MKAMLAGITFFLLVLGVPSRTGRIRFIQLTTALSISAERSHPPYIAFAETERQNEKQNLDLGETQELSTETVKPIQTLSTELISLAQQDVLQLEAMTIQKPAKSEILGEDWSLAKAATEAPLPETALENLRQAIPIKTVSAEATSPGFLDLGEPTREAQDQQALENLRRSLGGGETPPETNQVSEVTSVSIPNSRDEIEIRGKFILTGGVGYTNDHHFDVRRRQEGVHEEQGTVDMRSNSYAIRVRGHNGEVVVRLRDQQDHILGEASFHLADLTQNSVRVDGPLLSLRPLQDAAGRFVSAYSPTSNKARVADAKASVLSGAMPITVARNGEFEFDRLQKGSFTLMSATAKNHRRTLAIVPAGFRSDLPLFPEGMVQSLRQIVSDQKQMNLNDPDAPLVWGRVLLNGKVLAGVRVEMESAPESEAIYFNELLLPDPKLKATSANGLYAFVNVPDGLHALLARRGDAYFSHLNVVTERGSISVGDLTSNIRTEQARLRVFDAFTGEARGAQLIHQGIEDEIEVGPSGWVSTLIPHEHRLSLIQVGPQAPYLAATYQSDDADGYVHFPLVRADWLNYLRVSLRLDDTPGSATVVGFVPNEAFTADAVEEAGHSRIVYFDPQGRAIHGNKGVAGGGFVIFGLSEGVREVTVIGETSGLVSTRVIAADPQSLNVLLFRNE